MAAITIYAPITGSARSRETARMAPPTTRTTTSARIAPNVTFGPFATTLSYSWVGAKVPPNVTSAPDTARIAMNAAMPAATNTYVRLTRRASIASTPSPASAARPTEAMKKNADGARKYLVPGTSKKMRWKNGVALPSDQRNETTVTIIQNHTRRRLRRPAARPEKKPAKASTYTA